MSKLLAPKPFLRVRCALAAATLFSSLSFAARADTPSTAEQIDQFVESVAKLTYGFAWPTATYRAYKVLETRPVEGGLDVIVLLDGISGLDDSRLWLKLCFAIRSNGLDDVRVVDHNAIIAAPFETSKRLAKATADLADRYAKSQAAARASVAAVCVVNNTAARVTFTYRWGDGDWKEYSLSPNYQQRFDWDLSAGDNSSPAFQIRYGEGLFELDRNKVATSAPCESAKKYSLTSRGEQVAVRSVN